MDFEKLRTSIGLALSTDLSNREIGRQMAVAYNSIRRYRKVARAAGIQAEHIAAMSDEALHARFSRRSAARKGKRLPDWSHVHRELQRKGVTRTLLWMEYTEEDPATAYAQSTFCELYAKWAGKQPSMRQKHTPGERGWADFSGTPMQWVDPATGECHAAQIFVSALGVSGFLFATAVASQRQEHWIQAHADWYEALGGVPKITVPDNLKAAVLKAGREPKLNPAYLDMARHYGTYILPARGGHPKDKAKAEGSVLLFLRWGIARLRNRVFHSLAELNAAIAECVDMINDRVMRSFKQSRRERFTVIDQPHLLPLPSRYEYGEWIGPVRVPLDYHVAVKGHFYSVPYRFVQQHVYARCTPATVELLCDGTRVGSHMRSEAVGGKTTDLAHMPEHHRAWADHTPERYLQWAQGMGAPVLAVIEAQLHDARHPAGALNACATLQKLARSHGQERFVLACAKALAIHSPTVKSIRSILQNRLERRADARNAQRPLPAHDNVRGASYYQNEEPNHAV